MNTKVMFSSKTDLWETPQYLFDKLDSEFYFDVDVCALPDNAKCKKYYTPEQDGLSQPWTGVCWCNPPYGREIGKWVEKAYNSAKDGALVVMLLPARIDTRWFHDYIYNKAEVRFIRGRLKFGKSKNSAPFPSMIVVFRQMWRDWRRYAVKQKPIELMHYSFGESEGNICGTCCNLRIVQYNDRRLRKCLAYGGLHSSKADWAMRWSACGLYGKPVSQQMVSDTAKRTFARIGICKDDDRSTEGQIAMEVMKDVNMG